MRSGPKPLTFHISMVASGPNVAHACDTDKRIEAGRKLQNMLQGIQLYQNHPCQRKSIQYQTIWEKGSVRLFRVERAANNERQKNAVVLVPSLINDATIFDLLEERSFARWLADRNLDVYILDWGDLNEDSAQNSLDTIIAERLVSALEYLKDTLGCKPSALGYCMGGTMLLAAAALKPGLLDRVVLLAAPWDFHTGNQRLTRYVTNWSPVTLPQIKEKNILPADWIQSMFAMLDPALAMRKFSRFADMDQASKEARIFVAVEDWLNSGQDLPAGIASQTIKSWFIENSPAEGCWAIAGRPVKLENVLSRVLVIASSKDRLVDYDGAHIVLETLPAAEHLDPECGHIGMIAGGNAVRKVWQPLSDFLLRP